MRTTAVVFALALQVVAMTACEDPFSFLFTFDRELPVSRGAIFGEVVRDNSDGQSAPYAQINLMGVGLVRQADSVGDVAITDLGAGTYVLRVSDDTDGDGEPERAGLYAATLAIADRPDSLGFGGGPQLVSTSLGKIVVLGAGALSGNVQVDDGTGQFVPPTDLGLAGRVLLFRDIITDVTGTQALTLGADAETHVDAVGEYRFNSAMAGEAQLVVTLHEADTVVGGVAIRGSTVFISQPQLVTLPSGGETEAAQVNADGIDENLEDATRDVEVLVNPVFDERSDPYAIFVPPGRRVSTCQAAVPNATQFDYERIVPATVAGISRLSGAPVGVWDVRLCGETRFLDPETGSLLDDTEIGTAQLYSLVVPPAEDGIATILTGPMVLQRGLDPCTRSVCPEGGFACEPNTRVVIRDCDGDAKQGLPPFDQSLAETVTAWATCAAACGALLGEAAAEATCEIGAEIYDCDDDGDAQTDASEPPPCYGPGLGDDRDGDGVCSGEDAFPNCAANTAAGCGAGAIDSTPAVPEEFGGEPSPEPDPQPDVTPEPGPVPDGFLDPNYGTGAGITVRTPVATTFTDIMGGASVESGELLFISFDDGVTEVPQVIHLTDEGETETVADLFPLYALTNTQQIKLFASGADKNAPGSFYFVGDAFDDVGGIFVPIVCRAHTPAGEIPVEDTGFNVTGCVSITPPFDAITEWNAVTVADNGNAVVVGRSEVAGELMVSVVEYDSTGTSLFPAFDIPIGDLEDALGLPVDDIRIVGVSIREDPTRRLVIYGTVEVTVDPGGAPFSTERGFYTVVDLPGQTSASFLLNLDPPPLNLEGDSIDAVYDEGDGSIMLAGTVTTGPREAPQYQPYIWEMEVGLAEVPAPVPAGVRLLTSGIGTRPVLNSIARQAEDLLIAGEEGAAGLLTASLWRVSPSEDVSTLFGAVVPELADAQSRGSCVFTNATGAAFYCGQFGTSAIPGTDPDEVGTFVAKLNVLQTAPAP